MALMQGARTNINVSDTERMASLLGGGAALIFGLSKRGALGWTLAGLGGALLYRGATGHCDMYASLGMNSKAKKSGASLAYDEGVRVDHSVTVNRSPEELYKFWRNFENLPRFMKHLENVRVVDQRRSHWVAKAPLGRSVEWDAEIVNEIENRMISWRSLEGADVDNAGSVHFDPAPDGRSTIVKVELQYNPPAGKLGAAVARLLGEEPNVQVREDLDRFRQLMESGEVSHYNQSSQRRNTSQQFGFDQANESSTESFPASDPPSWTGESLSRV